MFKSLVLVACLACIGLVLTDHSDGDYITKYDDINIEDIFKNDRLFLVYHKCLMDQGRCNTGGSELKKILPDAFSNGCKRCSEKQKEASKKIFKFLIEKKPEQWKALEDKYDPTGTYRAKYEAELKVLRKEIKNIK